MEKPYVYKPVPFFLIANLITWTAWMIAAYLSDQKSDRANGVLSVLELVGLVGPLVAALWMLFTSGSAELKRNFYERLLSLKLIKPSTLPALFLIMPAAVVVSVFLSHFFFGQSLGQLAIVKAAPYTAGFIPVPVMLFGAALVEELGWKGYGVDSLRGERTFYSATWIYAVLWIFWHLPLFFIQGYYHNMLLRENPLFALNFIVSVLPAAFIINWLWYKNRGNILIAVLFHATANCQGILQMGQIAKCIETVVLIVIAIFIVRFDQKMFSGKFPAQIGCFGLKTEKGMEC